MYGLQGRQRSVDSLDGSRSGVVAEVAENTFEVPPEASSEGDKVGHPRAAAPFQDSVEVFARAAFIIIGVQN